MSRNSKQFRIMISRDVDQGRNDSLAKKTKVKEIFSDLFLRFVDYFQGNYSSTAVVV